MVAVDQSQFPPISLTIPDGQPGTWRAEITAVDIPYNGYPVALAVGSTDLDENQPPIANAGPDQTVECTGESGANIKLNGTDSSDPDGDTLTYTWTGPFGTETGATPIVHGAKGTSIIMLKVDDGKGGTAKDTVDVRVVDTNPPAIINVQTSKTTLWPPNQKVVPVTVMVTATDLCSAATCSIVSVKSNEPVNGTGDGNTIPDWEITGPLTLNLRAERTGNKNGRVYTLTVKCVDAAGNITTKNVAVTVPHDKGNVTKGKIPIE